MPTLDSQVHAYERNHLGRPWIGTLYGPPETTGDQMVTAMDAVGVDGAAGRGRARYSRGRRSGPNRSPAERNSAQSCRPRSGLAQMPEPALISGPGVEALRRLPYRASQLSVGNRRGQSGRQCMCNLILHRENIGQIAVVAVGPDVIPCFSFYGLGSNADPIAGPAHAAF